MVSRTLNRLNARTLGAWIAIGTLGISSYSDGLAGGRLEVLLRNQVAQRILSESPEGLRIAEYVIGRPISTADDFAQVVAQLRLGRIAELSELESANLLKQLEIRIAAAQRSGSAVRPAGRARSASSPLTESKAAFLESEILLGREFSGVAPPSVTPENVLAHIQRARGGAITQHPRNPNKWILKDGEGLEWGAEADGGFVSAGRRLQVLEVQRPPLLYRNSELQTLPLQALKAAGAEPMYSVGGGHAHLDAAKLLEDPWHFVSVMNFLLNYEEILFHVFANSRRTHTIRKLSELRHGASQVPLSQILGQELNRCIDGNDAQRAVEFMSEFARSVVPTRETNINLKAWIGSGSKKLHGTLELRFLNAPKIEEEVLLEDELVWAIYELGARSGGKPIRYRPKVNSAEVGSAYLNDQRMLRDFGQMMSDLGRDSSEFERVFIHRIRERQHPGQ